MNLRLTKSRDGTPTVQVENPCCPAIHGALNMGFVRGGARKKGGPHLAFAAPGTMLPFRFCPWCGQRPSSQLAPDIVIPGMQGPASLRDDGGSPSDRTVGR